MHPVTLHPATIATTPPADLLDLIITQEIAHPETGRNAFHKGHRLTADDLPLLAQIPQEIHTVRLEASDVHEDLAARRLAELIRGDGLMQRDPVQSRVNIVATRKGLLRVDADAVIAINRPVGIGIFTALDRLPVLPGKIVAGAKIAPVAIPDDVLRDIAAYLANRPGPMLTVKPFLPFVTGVIVTEGVSEKVRDRFEQAVRRKIGWYGASVLRFAHVANTARAVADAAASLLADGATLLLTAGGNMMDPLDASLQALSSFDAELTRLGAPAHPGSMFWLGYTNADQIPVVNLASCSMYSKSTVADLVLPWVMAGETVTSDDLASLGYGGLLDRDMSWRFPQYDADAVDEPDET